MYQGLHDRWNPDWAPTWSASDNAKNLILIAPAKATLELAFHARRIGSYAPYYFGRAKIGEKMRTWFGGVWRMNRMCGLCLVTGACVVLMALILAVLFWAF